MRALHVPETAESLGREPRGDLRRWARAVIDAGRRRGGRPRAARASRDRVLPRPADRLLAGQLRHLSRLQPRRAAGRDRRAAARVRARPPAPLGASGADGASARAKGPPPIPDRAALDLVRRLSAEDFGAAAAQVTRGRRPSSRRPELASVPGTRLSIPHDQRTTRARAGDAPVPRGHRRHRAARPDHRRPGARTIGCPRAWCAWAATATAG